MVSQRSFWYAVRQISNFSCLKERKNFAIIPAVIALAVACGCGGSSYDSGQAVSAGALQITPTSLHLVANSPQEQPAAPISIRNTSSRTLLVTSLEAHPGGLFRVAGQSSFLLKPNQVQQLTVVFMPGWLGMASNQRSKSFPIILPKFACCQGTLTISTPGAVAQVSLQGDVNTAQPSKQTHQTVNIAISPSSANVQPGQNVQFTASSNGHNIPVVWSASLGSINSAGLYVAPSVSRSTVDVIAATSAMGATGSAAATVNVTVPAPPSSPQPPSPQPPPPPPTYSGSGYYISPSGSDSNPGTPSQPWKTFAYAISQLKSGDNLVLEDGLYTGASSGYPYVNCSSGAANGTASAPIAIRAQHERAAFIQGNGTAYPVAIVHCQYWQLIGLHVENGDFNNRNYTGTSSTEALYGDAIFLYSDSHLTLQRNLIAHNNRYANSHLVDNYYTTSSLYEENEFYYFHRHGILDMFGAYNTYRRNYFNSRSYADISGGRYSADPNRGDTSISLYPAQNDIVENNVSEGNQVAEDIQCAYVSTAHTCNDNAFWGNVSLRDQYGFVIKARGTGDLYMPHNTNLVNDVVIAPALVGMFFRANKNTTCTNCTVLDIPYNQAGLLADAGGSGETGDGNYSLSFSNAMAVSASGGAQYGLALLNSTGNWTWSANYAAAYGSQLNFYPALPNPNVTSATTANPNLGSCKVWLPSGSSVKGAGAGGADIGANILYQYYNGSPTTQPLWDPATGQFPHGTLVQGVNDIAGQSAFDVNVRLNVNSGGCAFPSNYP